MFRQITRLRRRNAPRLFSFLLVALLVAISSIFTAAQDVSLSPAKRAQIEKAVSAFMTATSVPAVSIAIVQNGQPVWSSGFGGGQQGTSTAIMLAPQKSAAVVVLANMDDLDVYALAKSLLRITLDLQP
jgi:CubicO group peptidase (beta-lactamase class C family)